MLRLSVHVATQYYKLSLEYYSIWGTLVEWHQRRITIVDRGMNRQPTSAITALHCTEDYGSLLLLRLLLILELAGPLCIVVVSF